MLTRSCEPFRAHGNIYIPGNAFGGDPREASCQTIPKGAAHALIQGIFGTIPWVGMAIALVPAMSDADSRGEYMKDHGSNAPDPISDARGETVATGFAVNDPCARVSTDIMTRLLANGDIDSSRVHVVVTVVDNESTGVAVATDEGKGRDVFVTLSGTVMDGRQRGFIEELVASCQGVGRIDNHLDIANETH